MIKALIFDFDGLIIDTESAIYQSYQEIYAAHGCTLSLERWAQGIGTTDSDYDPYSDLEALLGCALDRQALDQEQRQREAELIKDLPVLPGVVDYLEDAPPPRSIPWREPIWTGWFNFLAQKRQRITWILTMRRRPWMRTIMI